MARTRWAAGYARRVLTRFQIEQPPVPVEQIAHDLGVRVRYEDFPDELSGAIAHVMQGAVIAVNTGHRETRQRFTIAHELGHYLMHREADGFYDRGSEIRVDLRSNRSAMGTDSREIEANRFAAELLMPRRMILAAINDAHRIEASTLALTFGVSEEAMTYRLADLRVA